MIRKSDIPIHPNCRCVAVDLAGAWPDYSDLFKSTMIPTSAQVVCEYLAWNASVWQIQERTIENN